MRGSGVTAARSCLQPLVSASRYLAIHALPGDPFYFVVEAKSRVKEVYAQTCVLLGQQGMRDCELFGLAILSDGEYLFVDPESKLSKYAPKNWRSSHTYGLDSSGRPAFVLYFRVRYYVDTPLLLSDETTRHHYYLQLRDNVVRHGGGVESLHPHHPLHATSIVAPLLALAGLALQADLGDYAEERHRPHAGSVGYCKPSDYLPPHMCLESDVLSILGSQHRENHGLSREEAEFQYIQDAVLLEAPLNAHLYRLRRNKSEAGPGRILLAICARGVRVYTEEATPRIFAWNNIGKLCFDRKKFEIRAVDQPDKLTLYSGCDDKSKLLLGLCRDTHQFSMAIAPRVTEAKRREEEERKVLRDCYMYPARCKLSMAARGGRGDQRISVISSTSSNTTSGIVSDRVHSEDEPDTAPASTECLPRLTEANGHASSLQTNEVDGADSAPAVMMTSRHGAVHPLAAADGSQCSSSCSTVVVVNQLTNPSSQRARRTSATSSLELGYSHTAQNSAVSSDATGFPCAIYDRCKKVSAYADASVPMSIDDGFGVTDIASETSGIYTLRSSGIQDERITELYSPSGDRNGSSTASDVCAVSSVRSTTDEASVTSGFYTIHSDVRSEASDVYTIDASNGDEPIYSICKGDEDNDDDNGDDADDDAVADHASDEDGADDDECGDPGIVGKPSMTSTNGPLDRNLDESRSRSNSILSAGSFRGDGSDPSDIGPLLSADELSDLIVGRYPPRKTISTSMDSDCDYVTMPPPLPPPRIDSCERQLPPPPPYPSNVKYATISSMPRSMLSSVEREALPPPPYNAPRADFVPLPPRRSEPPPPPPPYTSPRERIQIPPPTPPRNDAVTPREPPPPPPPYPDIPPARQEAISKLYPPSLEEQQSSGGLRTSKRQATIDRRQVPKPVVSVLANDPTVAPKPPPRIQPPTYPGDKMKPTPVHAPVAALVVGPNNYLDVHASRNGPPVLLPYLAPPPPPPPPSPPPMIHPRQPPPPPPTPSLATVYTSQVARSQIEQYRQQLYSDVDFVMFPLKDPAVSKQEYMDAKQGSLLAAMAAYPPPPYPAFNKKSSVVYRSTPYLTASSFSSSSNNTKYASNLNLSDISSSGNYPVVVGGNLASHYAASTSSLYSGATCSSSVGSHSLRREPPVPVNPYTLRGFARTRSDENILQCFETPANGNNNVQSLPQTKHRRLPPPPPPPPYEIQSLEKSQPLPSASSSAATSQLNKKPARALPSIANDTRDDSKDDGMLDIRTLREKSRNLDLPLISALCNDRYLLKQTKAFVLPKHPSEAMTGGPLTSKTSTRTSANGVVSSSSRNKYPVSGLSTTQITKPPRKTSTSTHRHPAETRSNAYKGPTSAATSTTSTTTTMTLSSSSKRDLTRASHS